MSDSINQGSVVLCPFWREWRAHFGVRVCDNLVGGVPQCVVSDFYPDDPFNPKYDNMKICRHFVFSDVLIVREEDGSMVGCNCLFGGGKCIHQDVMKFCACVGCSRLF